MIDFDEAINLINNNFILLATQNINIYDALDYYLAEDIYAPIDLPSFDNSAVDGFALCCDDLLGKESLNIATNITAAKQEPWRLPKDMCARIMTGAPIPIGADAVMMKEDVTVESLRACFSFAPVTSQNLRFKGEDIKQGEIVASKSALITPQLSALLWGLGLKQVLVYKKPKLAIIATGDELVLAGESCSFGEVYFLNGPMLRALSLRRGIKEISLTKVRDHQQEIESAIGQAFGADVILLSGGMSKGEHDFVMLALKNLGAKTIFYQGKWRPGKPLFFGQLGTSYVFGLPGNPVASFVCFKIFVEALLDKMQGCTQVWQHAQLAHDYAKKPGFVQFARAKLNKFNKLTILPEQGSHHIAALSRSNAICYLDKDSSIIRAGHRVKYIAI